MDRKLVICYWVVAFANSLLAAGLAAIIPGWSSLAPLVVGGTLFGAYVYGFIFAWLQTYDDRRK